MIYSLWNEQIPFMESGDEENAPVLTLYLASDSTSQSAVIVCPGGGYHHRANHEGEPIAKWLNSLGISAFVLNYRVAPYRHPVPLADAQRAIRFVRYHAENWNIDKQKIGILGFSAGGHLAASASTLSHLRTSDIVDGIDLESCHPNFSILCYPVISLLEHCHEGSILNLLGNNPSEDMRTILSCERNVSETVPPPTFLWHTADDASVPVENSLLYAASLSELKVPYEMHIFPHGRHGLGLAADNPTVEKWTELCANWLAQQKFC
ncbi:alpha/beta hydrolase [Ectobacillus funiculus]